MADLESDKTQDWPAHGFGEAAVRCPDCKWGGYINTQQLGDALPVDGAALHCPGCGGTSFLTFRPVSHPVELAPDTVFALANLPSTGPSGGRDNVARAVRALAYLLPRAGVSRLMVTHDDTCPATDDGKGFEACTCDVVSLGLRGADVLDAEKAVDVVSTLQGGNGGRP